MRIDARAKFGTRAFQRVGGWRGEDAAHAVGPKTIQQVLEVVGGKAGTGGVVDKYPVVRECTGAQRGETLPQLGVSPGFKDMRWPYPVHEGDIVSYSVETVSKRETSKPRWGLVTNTFRGVNQRGEEVLAFSSAVLIARRPEDS